jgi:hypothetical protein
MSEYHEYVSVTEAVKLSGKSEKTIRLLVKELLEVQEKTSTPLPELLTEVKGDNQRQFYKISLQYLQKRFSDTSGSGVKTSGSTSSTTSGSREEVDLLHQWLEDKSKTIELLTKELQEKNSQLERFQQLLENQQKLNMHSQFQLEKVQLTLEEKSKKKKILGLF